MLRTRSALLRSAVMVGLASIVSPFLTPADGAILYGNFSGPDITYQAVTEVPNQSPGPAPASLFGPPTLTGDSLLFDPENFDISLSGGSSEFQDGRLTMSILPTVAYSSVKMISLTEGGAWIVDGGTSATTAEQSLLINQLFITSVNGTSVNPIVVSPTITYTDTNNGAASVSKTANSIEFASSGGVSSGTWDATASFNLSSALQSAGLTGNVTGLSLSLDNQLAVNTETNSEAFIDKKFFDVTGTTSVVPEPMTGTGIILIGASGLLWRPRKARQGAHATPDLPQRLLQMR
jgi:hypothetical protein